MVDPVPASILACDGSTVMQVLHAARKRVTGRDRLCCLRGRTTLDIRSGEGYSNCKRGRWAGMGVVGVARDEFLRGTVRQVKWGANAEGR